MIEIMATAAYFSAIAVACFSALYDIAVVAESLILDFFNVSGEEE